MHLHHHACTVGSSKYGIAHHPYGASLWFHTLYTHYSFLPTYGCQPFQHRLEPLYHGVDMLSRHFHWKLLVYLNLLYSGSTLSSHPTLSARLEFFEEACCLSLTTNLFLTLNVFLRLLDKTM